MTTTDGTHRRPMTADEARVRRAHLLTTVGLLVACAVAYLGSIAVLAGELPERLAVHFGFDGKADRLMATPLALLVFGAVALGVPALLLVISVAGQWWRGATARMTSAFVSGLAAGLVALFIHLLWSQRGLVDAMEARLFPVAALWGLGAALAVGLAVAALLPAPLPQPEPVPAQPMDLAPTDRVSWFGRAVTSRTVGLLLAAVLALVLLVMLALQQWWLLLLLVALVLLVPMASVFRVRVDRTGLTWGSALGWPRGHVPMDQITGASVVEVRPGDFGGYGIRSVPGATGLITRSGSALSVTHRAPGAERGRRLVITVDDAMTAASVIEALRRR